MYHSQNVRGFKRVDRHKWMSGWRVQSKRTNTIAWGLQETHIDSESAAQEAADSWSTNWGAQYSDCHTESSYWSVSADKTGGVAILLDPRKQQVCQRWHPELWSKRVIAVIVDSILLVNVYAPNDRQERERLFRLMREWPWPQLEVVLFGDFNCVQSPHLDRLGGLRSGRPESPELETLLQALGLEDAQTLAASAMEDEVPEPVDYYTFWNARSASRIDRFYVNTSWTAVVQQVQVQLPVFHSDHQQIILQVAVGGPRRNQRNKTQPVHYPIRTQTPARVHDELSGVNTSGGRTGSQHEDMGQSGSRLRLKYPSNNEKGNAEGTSIPTENPGSGPHAPADAKEFHTDN
ncbi:unnamed protein product [Peronospora farinosa]|uniref:Endonuclease/exonuclease/phosphatase domain-containing protein n=1 Tax=Peronospora farinosa TaxID=134698 RepID=A0AAV0T2Y5_9STRA|nr:unnamed protein product [Peronospora farinosa]